jgi:phosphoenolpyruvate---glycerone phosphotransferase subunit DhaL
MSWKNFSSHRQSVPSGEFCEMAGLTSADLGRAASRLAKKAEAAADSLNSADALLGDGDLGVTLSRGWQAAAAQELPEDVGLAFLALAKAFQATASSSFGTLTATGLMSAAAACKGRNEIAWKEVPTLLTNARDAMMNRGKGELGQKSVLDTIDAIAAATAGLEAPAELMAASRQACERTLDSFRDKPNGLGRARMFGEKSIGIDDPGMLALRVIVLGLAEG